MAIQNTTPTPNELYNGEMRKMNDTQLRIVLIVTRATLGWEADPITGMRKKEDWISQRQLIEKSGRGSSAISHNVNICIKNGWIEARNKNGDLLNTPQKRERNGGKIFYRLGMIFLKNVIPLQKVVPPPPESVRVPLQKVDATKETLYKRNTNKKDIASDSQKVRKKVTFNKETYNEILTVYQDLRGITLKGNEFLPIQQAIKTILLSGRKPEDIISFMKHLSEDDFYKSKWTINTVRLKLPDFVSGGMEEEADVPSYAKTPRH